MALALQAVDAAEPADGRSAIQRANAEMMARHYPKGSLKRGEEGTVGISVTTDTRGMPTDCEVTKSSGYRELDSATCELLLMYGRTKPFTDGNRRIQKKQEGQFVWTLPPGVAKAVVADANKQSVKAARKLAANDPNRMICRTSMRTGSNAQRTRICMTRSEWIAQRQESQTDMQDMQRRQSMNAN